MTKTGNERVQKSSNLTSMFKYYIHDLSQGYTLEMYGPLGETAVSELTCCWNTARTTLRDRNLTLDLRGITLVDETARQWIAAMAQDGAKLLPETFLLDTVAGLNRKAPGDKADEPRVGFFYRLFRFALRPAR
jgi:hypothetical protein